MYTFSTLRLLTILDVMPTNKCIGEGVNAIYMKFIKAHILIKLIGRPLFYLIPILWPFCWNGVNTVCAIWTTRIHICTLWSGSACIACASPSANAAAARRHCFAKRLALWLRFLSAKHTYSYKDFSGQETRINMYIYLYVSILYIYI